MDLVTGAKQTIKKYIVGNTINTLLGKYNVSSVLNMDTFLYNVPLSELDADKLLPIVSSTCFKSYYIFDIREIVEYLDYCKKHNLPYKNPYDYSEFTDECVNSVYNMLIYQRVRTPDRSVVCAKT